jgi:serine/threonine protein kinase
MDDFDTDKDLSFLTSADSLDYVKKIKYNSKKSKGISQLFPNSDPDLVEMVRQMLEFNPFFRPSAKQLIQSKLFDNIRIN